MSWRGLWKLKPKERLPSLWFAIAVDALDELYGNVRNIQTRGTAESPWDYFYGYYGFFDQNLFVQGKPVIKDGDPVSVYDLGTPAQEKITQSIDNALITQYTRESRDVLTKVSIDQYGRVGIKIAEPIDMYGRVEVGGSVLQDILNTLATGRLFLNRPDVTVGSTEAFFISSGSEAAFKNLIINGEVRVDGKLIAKSITVNGVLKVNGVVELD